MYVKDWINKKNLCIESAVLSMNSKKIDLKTSSYPKQNTFKLRLCIEHIHHGLRLPKFDTDNSLCCGLCHYKKRCDLKIWRMALKNTREPLLCYIKLCASFQSHRWIQTGGIIRKRSIRVKIGDFLSSVTSKFDGRPWKSIGHLFNDASSFVHHFIAVSEFKLKLQSENAQFGSKSVIYCPVWPWNLTDDLEKQLGTPSMLHFIAISEFKLK